jgi:hypothetical protein
MTIAADAHSTRDLYSLWVGSTLSLALSGVKGGSPNSAAQFAIFRIPGICFRPSATAPSINN